MHFLCISIYILVSFGHDPDVWHDGASGSRHHCPARVSGLDRGVWHDGASGSRHHRSARGFDHDPGDRHYGLFSARSSPRDTSDRAGTAVDTPAERGHYARCWQPWAAVRLLAHTGLGESRPGYGLRQQRRVHAVFGGRGDARR
jgi:hypothetical protein